MHCPSCSGAMESVTLTSHSGMAVEVDVCGPCHVIWFDYMESTSLSPGSVIELFKRIHAARDVGRNLVKIMVGCPQCKIPLKSTTDLAKSGRFSYSRCPDGHGRLISFTQFLREKSFIRSLQPYEISALAVKVKQIRCSSCGGSISLETDVACTHCGSAISVLDDGAVEKALVALQSKEIHRTTLDPARMNEALLTAGTNARSERMHKGMQHSPSDWLNEPRPADRLTDLVDVGLGAVLALWLSS